MHARKSSSATSTSLLLSITTERLAHETERANSAERKCLQLAVHLRSANERKDILQLELNKLEKELELYRVQLDLAQQDIQKAQEIVAKIDQARLQAEEQAARDRTRARHAIEKAAINNALQQGRELGYKEGFQQGETLAWSEAVLRYNGKYAEGSEGETKGRQSATQTRTSPGTPGSSRRTATSRSRRVGTPVDVLSMRPSSVVHWNANSNTPISFRARSSSVREPRAIHASLESPENIDVHVMPNHNAILPVSRHLYDLPPEGYIPMMDASSVISLPPPHELSRPIPVKRASNWPADKHSQPNTARQEQSINGDPSRAVRLDTEEDEQGTRILDSRTRSNSTESRSTHISEYEFVRPPSTTSEKGIVLPQPEQAAENWRVASAEGVNTTNHSANTNDHRSPRQDRSHSPRERTLPEASFSLLFSDSPYHRFTLNNLPAVYHRPLRDESQIESSIPTTNKPPLPENSDTNIGIHIESASNSPSSVSHNTQAELSLLNPSHTDSPTASSNASNNNNSANNAATLSDDYLPPGFVPLSPIQIPQF
ncbi:hypothetical protein AX17_006361 [Amanita inopinata Kibby_2008]|nr:hypothetical protein AX17_006361 [Amanita inopinata Kibby_2008]